MTAPFSSTNARKPGPAPFPLPDAWIEPIETWRLRLVAKGRSAATVATRTGHLRSLARALEGDPRTLTADQLVEWCGRQEWNSETRNSHYFSYESFFGLLHRFQPQNDPTLELEHPARHRGVPNPAPDSAIERALKTSSERDQLLIETISETGARISEAVKIHSDDISPDLFGHSLLLHGKGNRDRIVPIPSPALASRLMHACIQNGGYAFPSPRGGHLSAGHAGKIVGRALGPGWSAHPIRHRYATKAHEATGNIRAVQELLGHANLQTTQRYTKVSDETLRRAAAGTVLKPLHGRDGITVLAETSSGHVAAYDHIASRVAFASGDALTGVSLSPRELGNLCEALELLISTETPTKRTAPNYG